MKNLSGYLTACGNVRSRRGKRAWQVMAIILPSAVGSCYEPTFANCELVCGPRMACPNAMVCDDGLCGDAPGVCDGLIVSADMAVRGYNRSDGAHAVLYRTSDVDAIVEVSERPFGSPTRSNLGGPSIGAPWGYVRSDNVNAVTYVSQDQHVHELSETSDGVWVDSDLSLPPVNAPMASVDATDAIGYVRTDGNNAVVFKGTDDHIYEIADSGSGFQSAVVVDVTSVAGGLEVMFGSAMPYLRSDGKNDIVFVAIDGHVHEVLDDAVDPSKWIDSDLFINSGETVPPSTDPWGYKRFDNVNAVVYVGSDSKLHELSYEAGTACNTRFPWCTGIIAAATNPSGGVGNRPSACVRWDNLDTVVYVSDLKTLREVTMAPGGMWSDEALPLPWGVSAGQPFTHRASGTRNAVLFAESSPLAGIGMYELSLPEDGSWQLEVF